MLPVGQKLCSTTTFGSDKETGAYDGRRFDTRGQLMRSVLDFDRPGNADPFCAEAVS